MNRAFPRAASACTLALGLSLGGLAWADTATLPPGPLIDINSVANSLGTGVDAATTKSNSLTGNTVTLTSGAVDGYVVGAINLEDTDAVSGNTVTLSGGDAAGSETFSTHATYGLAVAGGYADNAAASDNTVTISGGTVDSGLVVGGMGGSSATGNTVTVSAGTISVSGVTGGFTINGSASAAATGNTVNITGGTIAGGINGGRVYAVLPSMSCSLPVGATYDASNNTVNISGTPDLSAASVIGGTVALLATTPIVCPSPPGGYPFTTNNNTLNLHSASVQVAGLAGFNTLNFYLPATLTASQPMLTDTASSVVVDISSAAIHVATDATAPATLHDGDAYTLISAPNGSLSSPFTALTGTITDATGAAFPYTVDVDASSTKLVLKIGTAPPVPPSASAAAVPATSPAALALLALLLAATGWLARRGARR